MTDMNDVNKPTEIINVMSEEQYNEAVSYIKEYKNKTNINKIEESVLMLVIESVEKYEEIKLNIGE